MLVLCGSVVLNDKMCERTEVAAVCVCVSDNRWRTVRASLRVHKNATRQQRNTTTLGSPISRAGVASERERAAEANGPATVSFAGILSQARALLWSFGLQESTRQQGMR